VQALNLNFDESGQLTRRIEQRQNPDGTLASTRSAFDSEGRLVCAMDVASGNRIVIERDVLNQTYALIISNGHKQPTISIHLRVWPLYLCVWLA